MYTNRRDGMTYIPGDIVEADIGGESCPVLVTTLEEYNKYWVARGHRPVETCLNTLYGKFITPPRERKNPDAIYIFYMSRIKLLKRAVHEFSNSKYKSLYE